MGLHMDCTCRRRESHQSGVLMGFTCDCRGWSCKLWGYNFLRLIQREPDPSPSRLATGSHGRNNSTVQYLRLGSVFRTLLASSESSVSVDSFPFISSSLLSCQPLACFESKPTVALASAQMIVFSFQQLILLAFENSLCYSGQLFDAAQCVPASTMLIHLYYLREMHNWPILEPCLVACSSRAIAR